MVSIVVLHIPQWTNVMGCWCSHNNHYYFNDCIYIKRIMKIPRILVFPIFAAIVVVISVLVGFIAHWSDAYNPTAWGFFTLLGILGALIVFVFGRQTWWLISGTGDYQGRVGLLKKLWWIITKKKIDEDQDQEG
jgi:hypothetical protein